MCKCNAIYAMLRLYYLDIRLVYIIYSPMVHIHIMHMCVYVY